MSALAEVLENATKGRCSQCLRPLATDDDWETTKGGERPDLCWESYNCPWEPQVTAAELQAAAVLQRLGGYWTRTRGRAA